MPELFVARPGWGRNRGNRVDRALHLRVPGPCPRQVRVPDRRVPAFGYILAGLVAPVVISPNLRSRRIAAVNGAAVGPVAAVATLAPESPFRYLPSRVGSTRLPRWPRTSKVAAAVDLVCTPTAEEPVSAAGGR
ncbi:hypothetical protein HBB16_03730 [Pseudonocardia sp. MCCB 268]|nr:hypothetical protein [Pseudonocardia cytotoxica]